VSSGIVSSGSWKVGQSARNQNTEMTWEKGELTLRSNNGCILYLLQRASSTVDA